MAFVSFSLSPDTHVCGDVIPISALLYIINFANFYQNGPPKKLENNFLVSTLGKLLVFVVNYANYATLFDYEKVM
jgi:hypothetical protein